MSAESRAGARSGHAMLEGRRVLVLGATGFIGRRVVRALVRANASVTASGRDPDRLADLQRAYGVRALPCDLMPDRSLTELVGSVRPHVTFNLAGYGVSPTERDPDMARLINAELPQRLARVLAALDGDAWPGQLLIHAGSALEYGGVGGVLAEDGPAEPDTLYGRSKLEGTRAVAAEVGRTGARAVTARLFTVYGPGERPGRLLPALIEAARTGRPVPLTTGIQRRDFVYADDVAEAMLRLAASEETLHEAVNVATGALLTVREFVERSAAVLGLADTQLLFGSIATSTDEITHEPVSNARLRSLTGWVPTTSVEQGVALTVTELGSPGQTSAGRHA